MLLQIGFLLLRQIVDIMRVDIRMLMEEFSDLRAALVNVAYIQIHFSRVHLRAPAVEGRVHGAGA